MKAKIIEREPFTPAPRWTYEEETRLMQAVNNGTSINELVQLHGRSKVAIRQRVLRIQDRGFVS